MRISTLGQIGLPLGLALGLGCANDPMYVPAPTNLEGGVTQTDMNGMQSLSVGKASLLIPFKTETPADAMTRATLATKLGVMVPYVKIGDVSIEIEWTLKNLDKDNAGRTTIELNGANEFFSYDPSMIVLDPNAEEAPPTPGLSGDIPIDVPAGGSLTGVFREDQVLEASIDLDQITRGNVNPFAATLTINKNDTTFQPLEPEQYDKDGNPLPRVPMGMPIPRAAWAGMVRVDLVLAPSTHMVLDYDVRVRDIRGIVDDKGLTAPMSELYDFGTIPDWAPAPAAGSGSAG